MRKKGLSEVMVREVTSLCEGGIRIFRGIPCKSWCTSSICAVATIVCSSCGRFYKNARRGVINELLNADDLAFMSETMEDLKDRLWNWKDALKSKGLKVNTRKTKVMVSGSEEELFKSKIES